MNNKTEWAFEQIWNDSLTPVERNPEPRERIFASELGGAMIDRFLKMKGVAYSTPPNMRSLRKFQAGVYWEWVISLVLKRAGLIISQQDRLEYAYDGLLPVSGAGIGIDRLLMLLLGKKNIRDVIMFPQLKDKNE